MLQQNFQLIISYNERDMTVSEFRSWKCADFRRLPFLC